MKFLSRLSLVVLVGVGVAVVGLAHNTVGADPVKGVEAVNEKKTEDSNSGPQAEIKKATDALIKAFDAGQAKEVANLFLPEGEWVDELGNIYHGRENIENVLTTYFEKYPGAKMTVVAEKGTVIGPLAFEEGTRTMSCGEDANAVIQYVAVLAKTDEGWKYASVKDTEKEMVPTAHSVLQNLEWLVGDWVNEENDGRIEISYRWSDDGNFLLGTYHIESDGQVLMKSDHRIGWDPLHQRVRSWLFDSDGSFGEGVWTPVGEGWHIQSSAILPDGGTGTAIVTIQQENDGRFVMRGTNRLINGNKEEDFEVHVVRKVTPEVIK